MRISDWSSDVCSSDLDADDVREGPLPDAPADAGPGPSLVGFRQSEADGSKALDDLRRHVRVLAHHPILAALADTCCQRPGEPCGMSVASATGAAAILGHMEHRVALGDGDAHWAEELGRTDETGSARCRARGVVNEEALGGAGSF